MCRDHAHTCLRIAPRRSVGDVAGRLRGKGAMIPRERRPELLKDVQLTEREKAYLANLMAQEENCEKD